MNQLQTHLETIQKVSHQYHIPNPFHDQLKFKAILKFKCDQPEWKISITSEMLQIILRKFMNNHNIHNMYHTKNQKHWTSFGMANSSYKLNKQKVWHKLSHQLRTIITQKWQLIKIPNQHQNVKQCV